MQVTKSWERNLHVNLAEEAAPAERRREFFWMLGATFLVACALAMAGIAKMQELPGAAARLDRGELLNINTASGADDLLPFLAAIAKPDDRQRAAEKILAYRETHPPFENDGALARLRLGVPIAKLKPLLIVRTPRDVYVQYALWCAIYFASFWAVHLVWRWRRFRGDAMILPALHLLTGIGLVLAVSLRDPLRDTLEFRKFAWGAALGCALLLLPLLRLFHYENFAQWTYTPLLAAFALLVLLMLRGSGPTGSDAHVNLGPFQPVEIIKILIVLFLAGYFSRKWGWLREVHVRKIKFLSIPRPAHVLPVMIGVSGALLLFFVLKDLGPALVIGFLFLILFAIARNRGGLALIGIAALVAGVAIGYHYGQPKTVVDRVSMWLSPWDNNVRGGDQLAHSLWAFSTGGAWGSGPGWGDPSMIPAGHTDLVLPAVGEEWGWAGVAAIGLLFFLLLQRAFRIALRAPDEFAMFLALGLGTLIGLEMLLISGGVLGAIPLSGVVSPFLSSGNTAMLSNFLIFAILAGISNQPRPRDGMVPHFRKPVRAVALAMAAAAVILVSRAAYYQILHDQEFLVRDAMVFQEDGVKRPQFNPRLSSLAREIPRGSIYDRDGVPIATSSWDELEKHRADYEKLGVSIDAACSRLENRHYPFGRATVHLVGDFRTAENFHASNTSLIEHDFNARLQGYKDLHELGALVRYRHQPANPKITALFAKDRSVRTSVDIRLQMRVGDLMRRRLEPAGKSGAAVVMDPKSGDVLALVSFPEPASPSTPDQLLDRARYGQYPPGSTFKLVTAMAALRLDPALAQRSYRCVRLKDGRAGAIVEGWRKPIRDDAGDPPHGSLTMAQALTVSCNAYFAQLGTYDVGAEVLRDTAALLDIPAGDLDEIRKMMPFASYGQGPVLVTPFKMARVAATIANAGSMPEGRWILGDANPRAHAPRPILAPESSAFLADAMRSVVTTGTGRRAMAGLNLSVAGKTGTAQLDQGAPHSWFAGFAPYASDRQIAFAVVVEHGGYGAQFAAPLARDIIEAARDLDIIR
ncbi:MAG TPA: FtsW/RodA/SpoVE family cell cycle protein [Bryobacteraceae bacterium]|nr:FtsW/RodA/SpoVE family cell cycle protein [Bryobacteraceae bacterium]